MNDALRYRFLSLLAASALVVAWSGTAVAAERDEEPTFSDVPTEKVVSSDQLPAGTVMSDLSEPLHLDIGPAPMMSLARVESQADSDLTVRPVPCDDDDCRKKPRTMVHFENRSGVKLKVDLYMSPDGEEWHYTSSCPFGSTYEMWPHPVPYLAITRPRFEPDDMQVCR